LWVQIDRSPTPSVHLISFPTSAHRIYFVQARTNLLAGGWTTARTNISGLGSVMAIPHTNTQPLTYFRVGVNTP
ncbi:MAG: hypothetical protein AAF492_30690, partial [Verrucomicrobiota bacterium]